MEFRTFDLAGPVEVRPKKHEDHRGYFSEILRLNDFAEHVGPANFVQENQSLSVQNGTVRGVHFQSPPAAQGKLVRCIAGKLFDVAVDLRRDSPTYGKWLSAILTSEENNQLWVPIGFGHGFCSLEPNSIISYRCTEYYSPENDLGVAWDDPDIGIDWPELAASETLSGKDRVQPSLANLPAYFTMENSRCA
jgi:dTDP-4-dehydrorhamnose 3,5-epimerase